MGDLVDKIRAIRNNPKFRTLPTTGPISASMINAELGRPATQTLSLNDPEVRALAGVPSGQISYSDLRGKSNIVNHKLTVGSWSSPLGMVYGFQSLGANKYGSFEPRINKEGWDVASFNTVFTNFNVVFNNHTGGSIKVKFKDKTGTNEYNLPYSSSSASYVITSQEIIKYLSSNVGNELNVNIYP